MVRTPDGRIAIDMTGKMPGRGAYVCESPACREAAFEKGHLQHALEMPIPVELRAELTGEAKTIEGGSSRGQE